MHRKVLNLRFSPSVLDKNRISNLQFFSWNEARYAENRDVELQDNRCGCQENPRAFNEDSLTRPQKPTCVHKIQDPCFLTDKFQI
jgi:hypothetical protein